MTTDLEQASITMLAVLILCSTGENVFSVSEWHHSANHYSLVVAEQTEQTLWADRVLKPSIESKAIRTVE
jgi:hypothetical protein